MRSFLATSAVALGLSACATQSPVPPAQPATPAPTSAAPVPAPQCWNGDADRFENVGTPATISGVAVRCEKTSDGKNAQWMGVKK